MLRTILSMTASVGVGQVVQNIVEVTTPKGLSDFKKVATMIGGMTFGAVLGDMAYDYVDDQCEVIAETVRELKSRKVVKSE